MSAIGGLITAKMPWCSLDVDICKAYHRYACEYVAGDVTAGWIFVDKFHIWITKLRWILKDEGIKYKTYYNFARTFTLFPFLIINLLVRFYAKMNTRVLWQVAGVGKWFVTLRTFVWFGLPHVNLCVKLKISFWAKYL